MNMPKVFDESRYRNEANYLIKDCLMSVSGQLMHDVINAVLDKEEELRELRKELEHKKNIITACTEEAELYRDTIDSSLVLIADTMGRDINSYDGDEADTFIYLEAVKELCGVKK